MKRLVTVLLAMTATVLLLMSSSMTNRYAGLLSAALLAVGLGFGVLAVTRAWSRPSPVEDQPSIEGSFAGPT